VAEKLGLVVERDSDTHGRSRSWRRIYPRRCSGVTAGRLAALARRACQRYLVHARRISRRTVMIAWVSGT
jgi:hypothetical protein